MFACTHRKYNTYLYTSLHTICMTWKTQLQTIFHRTFSIYICYFLCFFFLLSATTTFSGLWVLSQAITITVSQHLCIRLYIPIFWRTPICYRVYRLHFSYIIRHPIYWCFFFAFQHDIKKNIYVYAAFSNPPTLIHIHTVYMPRIYRDNCIGIWAIIYYR